MGCFCLHRMIGHVPTDGEHNNMSEVRINLDEEIHERMCTQHVHVCPHSPQLCPRQTTERNWHLRSSYLRQKMIPPHATTTLQSFSAEETWDAAADSVVSKYHP